MSLAPASSIRLRAFLSISDSSSNSSPSSYDSGIVSPNLSPSENTGLAILLRNGGAGSRQRAFCLNHGGIGLLRPSRLRNLKRSPKSGSLGGPCLWPNLNCLRRVNALTGRGLRTSWINDELSRKESNTGGRKNESEGLSSFFSSSRLLGCALSESKIPSSKWLSSTLGTEDYSGTGLPVL